MPCTITLDTLRLQFRVGEHKSGVANAIKLSDGVKEAARALTGNKKLKTDGNINVEANGTNNGGDKKSSR